MENDRKKFIRDTFFAFFPQIISPLIGLIIMVSVTRYIGAVGYGIWAQFHVTFSFLSVFVCMNLGHSMSRFLVGEKDNYFLSKVFSSVLFFVTLIGIFFGTFLVIFKNSISNFLFGGEEFALMLIFLFIILLIGNLKTECGAFLRARRYIKAGSLITIISSVITAILVFVVAIETKNIVLTIGSLVFVELITLLILIIFIKNKGIKIVKPGFSYIIPLLKFGVPLLMVVVGGWIVDLSDRYLIKYFLDISEVGIYSVGYTIGGVLVFFWRPLNTVLFPDLSALYDERKKRELESRFSRTLKYGVAVSIPAIVGLFILARPITKVLSGQEFLSGSSVVGIIAGGIFFHMIFAHFANLLNILMKVRLLSLIWIGMAILNIILNFCFIPKLGIIGAAYSTFISFLIGMTVIILYSRFYFNIFFKKRWFLIIIISCGIMGYIINLIPVFSLATLLAAVLSGVLIYGAILLLLKFCDKSELFLIKETFFKKLLKS